jgi:hypothetical protein
MTLIEIFGVHYPEFRMHPELIGGLIEAGAEQGNLCADKMAVRELLCQRYHQATV